MLEYVGLDPARALGDGIHCVRPVGHEAALREQITSARRGRRKPETTDEPAPARHVSMTPDQVRGRLWAQQLKRVFKIDIETCAHCGGAVKVKVIASIEDPIVIKKILEHLERRAEPATPAFRPFARPAARSIVGPEGTRLTADPSLRTDARLA